MHILKGCIVLAALALLLTGCGFKLRGQATLPPELASVYINTNRPPEAPPTELARTLRQVLEANRVKVTTDPQTATATVAILGEDIRRRTIATDATGQAREYTLTYFMDYTVTRPDGSALIPRDRLSISRNLLYPEVQVLGLEEGDELVLDSIRSDLSWAIVRRLEALAP